MKHEKIVHFVGFDFDGCLLPEELRERSIGEVNRRLLTALKKQGERVYATTVSTVISSRQSDAINEVNRTYHDRISTEDPTSCFLPIKVIAENDLDGTLCPFLLADAYDEKPDGYSYTRAVQRAGDNTAYHPGFIFDEYKAGLIYAQAHVAANHVRNCDFLALEGSLGNLSDLLKLPFRSNAAYVYIKEKNTLYYVNKIEKQCCALQISDNPKFENLLEKALIRIEDIEHDFDALYQNGSIQGITLSDDELNSMKEIANHCHVKKDYRVIFDIYDDRQNIFDDLNHTYHGREALLPKNMTIRFNLYNSNNPDAIPVKYAVVSGTGPIDLKPKETLVKMAREIVGREVLTDEDYNKNHDKTALFAEFIKNSGKRKGLFAKRNVVLPTVKHHSTDANYAPHFYYAFSLDPEDVEKIFKLIEKSTVTRSGVHLYFTDYFFAKATYDRGLLRKLLTSTITQDVKTALNALEYDETRMGDDARKLLDSLKHKYVEAEFDDSSSIIHARK
ncbi:MAG: hypothetical protein HY939_00305 [Gammaproteobacteria bacterium]|nr:hypothetical protein [Gammaproteobacteria bacterium]